jgi:hypothetical protein
MKHRERHILKLFLLASCLIVIGTQVFARTSEDRVKSVLDLKSKRELPVGSSLPAATLERRKIQEWNDEKYDAGFLYAWVVPGMARVAQAGGRVIRTPTDKGVVVLIGNRFHTKLYQQCIPQDWHPQLSTNIAKDIKTFFH